MATIFAAALALLALSRGLGGFHQATPALAVASSAAINPWSKDAPPPSRFRIVASGAVSRATPSHRYNPGETAITRDSTGHFHIVAQVNGQDSEFLVDTGADLVALTRAEAQRLGIFVAPQDFRPLLRTASGTADGALIRIPRLTVGGNELHDVPGVVVDGLGTNLLGQSALRQLGKLEQQGDRMVIDPG